MSSSAGSSGSAERYTPRSGVTGTSSKVRDAAAEREMLEKRVAGKVAAIRAMAVGLCVAGKVAALRASRLRSLSPLQHHEAARVMMYVSGVQSGVDARPASSLCPKRIV